jgi:hypothetical protein
MTIDVPPEQLAALAGGLHAAGEEAAHLTARLGRTAPVGGPVQPGVEVFLDATRAAADALAGELHWLGDTVAAVAASWLALDASQPAPSGRRAPE